MRGNARRRNAWCVVWAALCVGAFAPAAATEPSAGGETSPMPGTWRFLTRVIHGPAETKPLTDVYALRFERGDARWTASMLRIDPPRPERLSRRPVQVALAPRCAPGDFEVERATCRLSFSARLRFHGRQRDVRFELRFEGDRVDGYWEYGEAPRAAGEDEDSPRRPAVAGVLTGRRGSEAPKAMTAGTPLPCDVCCDAQLRCEGEGPRACNSSMTCLNECDERLEAGGRAATIRPCDWLDDDRK